MKVLKKGKGPKGWSIKTSCTGVGNGDEGCEAILLVEAGDVFRTESHCRDETTYYNTFRCPDCGHMNDLEECGGEVRVVPSRIHVPRGIRHQNGGYCHPEDPSLY